jgi:hypothetical protein
VMTIPELSLCAPDGQKTCFACCPPIRPAGYEHIRYKTIIQRILRENTFSYNQEDRGLRPITGFSCWALGYLDKEYRRIGCLLHPVQNQGIDLRYRVDYGEKCRRESCPESETFSLLEERAKRFWLHLADGLDSFAYSSRKENPLFHMVGWGTPVLGLIPSVEGSRYGRETFFEAYPFFQRPYLPRPPVYPAKRLIDGNTVYLLKNRGFREAFEGFCHLLSSKLSAALEQPTSFLPRPLSGSPTVVSPGLPADGHLLPPPLPPPPSSAVALLRRTGTKGGEVPEMKDRFAPLTRSAGACAACGGGKVGVKEIAALPWVARNDDPESMAGSGHGEESREEPPVHRLPLDRDFLDYLRLFAVIDRIGFGRCRPPERFGR